MLSQQTIATIKSTIPLIAETGPALTAHFYDRMFSHHPELKDIFNLTHQDSGAQREALFNAICAYAINIENLAAILPAVEKIAQKHASFNIQPEQYAIVGEHLLATLEEMFNPGDEILNAWGEAYQVLANVFIQREKDIYQTSERQSGGWSGLRPFRIKHKQFESDVICSFELEPVDGQAIAHFQPGQYLAVYITSPELENQEIRQYSLSQSPNEKTYRIAVKREVQGKVSTHLHTIAQAGDTLQVATPHGDFFLDTQIEQPVTLISGGVGLTPMLSMLNTLVKNGFKSQINWLHATENGSTHAFANEVNQLSANAHSLYQQIWYSAPREQDKQGQDYHQSGLMNLASVKAQVIQPEMHYYLCGPVGFMQFVAKQLTDALVPVEHIHYECFGPHKVL